jgi:gluconokinase
MRVAARPAHLFPVSLVDSQFNVLEDPSGEPGVLRLDATRPLEALTAERDPLAAGPGAVEAVRP